jgi:hypothetical protein
VSAAALRPAARWHRVARAEADALLRSPWVPFLLTCIVLKTMGPFSQSPFGKILELTLMMFFLPLLLWRGRGVRGSLDQALPVRTAAYELIRIGVGAAAALAILCVATQAHVWVYISRFQPSELAGFARGYTAALVIRGLALYLLASALVLRARRPGRVLLAAFVVGSLALFFLGGMETTTRELRYAPDGTVTARFGSSLTVGKALLQLAIGAAAVGLSVALGRREGGRPMPWRRAGGTAPAIRTTRVPRTALSIPRSPASMGAVVVRQLAVQAPRMTWPLLFTGVVAGSYAAGLARGALYAGGFTLLALAAFLWPVLVWMDERHGHTWDQAQPAGTLARRLLHALAGLHWLELCTVLLIAGHAAGAAREGAVWLDAWVLPGVPVAAAAVYCMGTVVAMLPRHALPSGIAVYVVGQAAFTVHALRGGEGAPGTLSLARVLGPLGGDPGNWSTPAALIWVPLLAGLAAAAIHLRIRWDQGGRLPRPAAHSPPMVRGRAPA